MKLTFDQKEPDFVGLFLFLGYKICFIPCPSTKAIVESANVQTHSSRMG